MNYGLELVDRLPRLAARFAAGEVDWPVIAAAVFRTELIRDRQVMARIDEVLARRVLRFNTLSRPRLAAAIDAWVSQLDPAAVRVPTAVAEHRYIEFSEARSGLVAFWGSVRGGVRDARGASRRRSGGTGGRRRPGNRPEPQRSRAISPDTARCRRRCCGSWRSTPGYGR